VGLLPGPVPHPGRDRAASRAAGEPGAGDRPRRGRRLRGQDRSLPRRRAARLAGPPPRAAGEVGGHAARGSGHHQPGARLGLRGRAGARRERPHHRPARADRLTARLLAHERGGGLAVESRAAAPRRLRRPQLRHHGVRRGHQLGAGGGLSRGRTSGGVLLHRAADGHRRAQARHRSGRAATAQPDPAGAFSFPDDHRPELRLG
jgi:hypothetical protein